jgi:replicative DNA helicase
MTVTEPRLKIGRLQSLRTVLEETNGLLSVEGDVGARVWPSGFRVLDVLLNGGFRAGELVLLGAGPGLGETTFALQVARNLAISDKSVVYFSFQHDNHSLLERLIVLEAAEIVGSTVVRLAEAAMPSVRRGARTG